MSHTASDTASDAQLPLEAAATIKLPRWERFEDEAEPTQYPGFIVIWPELGWFVNEMSVVVKDGEVNVFFWGPKGEEFIVALGKLAPMKDG